MGILGKIREWKATRQEARERWRKDAVNKYILSSGAFYIEEEISKEGYKQFRFYASLMDEDADYVDICLSIMETLSSQCRVITEIIASAYCVDHKSKKPVYISDLPFQLYQFYKAHDMTDNVFFDGRNSIVMITDEINLTLLKLAVDDAVNGNISGLNTVYTYSDFPDCQSFEEVQAMIEEKCAMVQMTCSRSHDYMSIIVDTRQIPVETILKAVQSACEKYGKRLDVKLDEKAN